jgi:ubiquinone/menaquinone biosynthesis C-methylase UbiE
MEKHDLSAIIHSGFKPNAGFEENYFNLRRKEGRIYADEIVAQLPYPKSNLIHSKEWVKRATSCMKLIQYIEQRGPGLTILEVGCGNGWLSNRMAQIKNNRVFASDVGLPELEQGRRIFGSNPNLTFVYSDLEHLVQLDIHFDLIVFASSIQYFPSLPEVIKSTRLLLKKDGELHILDSPLYEQKDVAPAVKRTKVYYDSIGFPEMADSYFHHSLDEVKQLGFQVLYSPHQFPGFLKRLRNPFYWVCLNFGAM